MEGLLWSIGLKALRAQRHVESGIVDALRIMGQVKYDDPALASLSAPVAISVAVGLAALGAARARGSLKYYGTSRKCIIMLLALLMSLAKAAMVWSAINLMAGPYVEVERQVNLTTGGNMYKANASIAVILVDVSKSMASPIGNTTRIGLAVDVACGLAEQMARGGARVHMALFADYVVRSFDYTGSCDDVKPETMYNYTTLREAVAYAASFLEKLDVPGTIVIVSDGEDNFPTPDREGYLRDIARMALSVNATVVGVWVGEDPASLVSLRSIAAPTGGLVVRPGEGWKPTVKPALLSVDGRAVARQGSATETVRDYETPRRALFRLLWILALLILLVGPW